MAVIYFAGTYQPIMCGIADYTAFITRLCPIGQWGVISFNLERYGVLLTAGAVVDTDRVWYGIPNRQEYSAPVIMSGLNAIDGKRGGTVLWFQHEHGIWPDDRKFATMLEELPVPKVVTFHTVHFPEPRNSHWPTPGPVRLASRPATSC